jgi:signal transduction histidine kinase/FixJ family two-component response regulator/tetratricopeptide (TPR) repeat protein
MPDMKRRARQWLLRIAYRSAVAWTLLALQESAAAFAESAASSWDWAALQRETDHDPVGVAERSERDLRTARESGNAPDEAMSLLHLTAAYTVLETVAAHKPEIERGLVLARNLNDMQAVCRYTMLAGDVSAASDNNADAYARWKEASAIAEANGIAPCLIAIRYRESRQLKSDGKKAEALTMSSDAYAYAEKHGDRFHMASMLILIGNIYNQISSSPNDLVMAIDYYNRASRLIDLDAYRDTAYRLNELLGIAYTYRHDYAPAERHLLLALQLARQLREANSVAGIEHNLGRFYEKQKRYSNAIEYLDLAREHYRAQGWDASYSLAHLDIVRASVLAELGRRQESLSALTEGLSRLEKSAGTYPGPDFKAKVQQMAQTVYERLGDYREAYRLSESVREQEVQLAHAANSKLSNELQVRFDVRLKESENETLRAREKEAKTQRLAFALALALSLLLLAGVAFYLRRRAEAARIESAHNKALADAEASANRAKSTFLANMSHELRTPLNAILGFTRLVSREPNLSPEADRGLSIVLKSGEHLYGLINQVLDLNKIETGHAVLNETDVDLAGLVDEMESMFGLTVRQKGLRLDAVIAPEVPRCIHADGGKLRQVLINLLGNALKFTQAGEVKLLLKRTRNGAGADCIACTVSDTGLGIAPDELAMLGSAFMQAQAGRQSREGTGLGLAISRGFVRLMGGQLEIRSEVGKGTAIEFEIPFRALEASNVSAAARKGKVTGLAPGQPRFRILAVDDVPEGRELLVRLLTPLGFEVREAADGTQAVAICEEWQPHLVWMDMRMPVMDGREVARRIKASGRGREIKIIALTASSIGSERQEILDAGCDDFLRKPFNESALFALLHDHLGVEFVEEDDTVAEVDIAGLAGLPVAVRMQFDAALQRLDAEAIAATIDTIRQTDAGMADALAQLAEDFQYETIRKLLFDPAEPPVDQDG